jgi:hypothetical protein
LGGARGGGRRCEAEEDEMLREDDEMGGLSWGGGEFIVWHGGIEFFMEDWFAWT